MTETVEFSIWVNDIAAIIVSETCLKRTRLILAENKIMDVPVLSWELLERM